MSAVIEPGTVKRALSAHAAIGLIAGALLYIVSLTGTVAVFYQELQRVEQPNAPEMNSISPEAVQKGVEAVLANEAGQPTTTHFYVHLPVKEVPRATATTVSTPSGSSMVTTRARASARPQRLRNSGRAPSP